MCPKYPGLQAGAGGALAGRRAQGRRARRGQGGSGTRLPLCCVRATPPAAAAAHGGCSGRLHPTARAGRARRRWVGERSQAGGCGCDCAALGCWGRRPVDVAVSVGGADGAALVHGPHAGVGQAARLHLPLLIDLRRLYLAHAVLFLQQAARGGVRGGAARSASCLLPRPGGRMTALLGGRRGGGVHGSVHTPQPPRRTPGGGMLCSTLAAAVLAQGGGGAPPRGTLPNTRRRGMRGCGAMQARASAGAFTHDLFRIPHAELHGRHPLHRRL